MSTIDTKFLLLSWVYCLVFCLASSSLIVGFVDATVKALQIAHDGNTSQKRLCSINIPKPFAHGAIMYIW